MTSKCRLLRALTVFSAALACPAAQAQTTQSGLDLGAETSVASNPYLSATDSSWLLAGKIEARPWLRLESARDTFNLAAYAVAKAFSGTYDLEDSEGASLSWRRQETARLGLYASADISSSSARSASQLALPIPGVTDPVSPVDPDMGVTEPLPLTPADDITLLGLIGRSTSMDAALGIDNQLDARSSFGLNAGYQRLSVSGTQLSSYDSFNVGARFVRQFGARTSAGVSAAASRSRYEAGGNAATYNVEATLDHQLDPYWFLDAAAGLSTTRSSATLLRPASSSTGLSGSLSLCNRLPRRDFCWSLGRAQLPSGLGSVQTVTDTELRYSERISARSRMDLFARYARSEAVGDELSATSPRVEVVSVQANVTRTMSESTEAYAFLTSARTYDSRLSSEPSASVGIGVRLRLGRRR